MDENDIQKAWNMMSMHNSELLLENYKLKERINKLEAQLLKKTFWGRIKCLWVNRRFL
jgi:regulator of replication initiation timing